MRLPGSRSYPDEIQIGDASYRVKFVKAITSGKDTLGECCPSEHVIRIKLGQSRTETFNTFVHECLHAFEFEYGIKISHKAIYQMERALSDFLMGNF